MIQPLSSTVRGPELQSDTSAPMKTHTEQTPQLSSKLFGAGSGLESHEIPLLLIQIKRSCQKKRFTFCFAEICQVMPGPSWWKVFMAKFRNYVVVAASRSLK